MRSQGIRLTIAMLAIASLVGCSGGSRTTGGGGNGPTLSSIMVTPAGSAITVGGSVQLKATGTYSDQSTQDLTNTATWASSASSVASVSGTGNVSGAAAGIATIKATSGTVSGSTAVSVGSIPPPPPNASYAFFLQFVDTRGQAVIVGSLTTDSSGNINGGVADYNTASGVSTAAANVTVSNYTLLADGRGTADVEVNSQTFHIAFVLYDFVAGVATKGKMISYDSNIAAGEFELQTAGANLAADTDYVFGFNGLDGSNQPEGEIGVINTDTSRRSYYDVNDNGTIDGGSNPPPSTGQVLSPVTINAVGTNNRGTATLGTANYAYYTTDGTKAYFIETDAASGSTALAGVAEEQDSNASNPTVPLLSPESTPSPCNSPTSGDEAECDYAFLLNHAAGANGTFERAGEYNFCNCTVSGGINHANEDDSDGSIWTITSGTRYFGAPRGVFNYKASASSQQGQRYAIVYEVNQTVTSSTTSSASRLYVMSTDSSSPGVGVADFINANANSLPAAGTYVYSATSVGGSNLLQLGLVVFDSSGNATGVGYINNNGTLSTAAVSGIYTPSTDTANGGNGRGTFSSFDGATSSLAGYNVGSLGLIVVDSSSHISGRLEPQQPQESR